MRVGNAVSKDNMTLSAGSLLQGGRYKIVCTLGQGGFGITYLAEQVMLGRKVAVKEFFMKDLCNRDEETSQVSVGSNGSIETVQRFKEKFLKEARLIATMDNSHIVRIHDIFEENGTAYYVMEYVDGGSLESTAKEGAIKETDAVKIIREVGSALSYIHKQNILHLDIKPSNILLRHDGEAVLIDFGISKRYDQEGGQTSTTPIGISKGYAPIEQYNQGLQQFSPVTDVYSLGATFYKLLTGQTPPEATMLLDDEFPSCPSDVTMCIWSAIKKAMEPIKRHRYQTVDEFLSAFSESYFIEKSTAQDVPLSKIVPMDIKISEETQIIDAEPILDNGHPYVDLGLSVKWAKTNLGATTEFNKGKLYPFAIDLSNSSSFPSDICGDFRLDYCRKVWGGRWRLPTKAEQDELRLRCKWKYLKEQACYKITGPSGNSIYLPITTFIEKQGVASKYCGYWSGSLHQTNPDTAFYIQIDSIHDEVGCRNDSFYLRMAIRGVID